MTPDLVVIGAGPAGLAAAIVAARHGVHTLVVERRRLPVDKACGEGVLPNGVEALARLGVSLEGTAATLTGVRYITMGGRMAAAAFPTAGLGVRRTTLSSALVARACAEPSLELRSETTADVLWSPDGARVVVDGAAWRPRLVIAADGLRSRVGQMCGIVTDEGRPRRWGVRQHFEGDAWTDHVEVYFGRGFEAYVTPVSGGVNVAWLWEPRAVGLPPGEDVCRVFASRIPTLAAKLSGRRATDRAQAAGPFRHQPRERARDGVLLMGDAAGYLDPLTGEGVGLALMQAELFERHVVPVLVRPGAGVIRADAFRSYFRAVDAAARSNRDLTRLMLALARRPAAVEHAVAALAADPALFRHCLEANMGRRRLWPMPMSSVARLMVGAMSGVLGQSARTPGPRQAGA